MSQDAISHVKFETLNMKDSFFSTLKQDYPNFEHWFTRKALEGEAAYVLSVDHTLKGFLYLKDENEEDDTITPSLEKKRRLKVGTFKIEAHGTILGQRFLSIIFQRMMNENFLEAYVTLFPKQKILIDLFERFGFIYWGKKKNGELVYVKKLVDKGDIYRSFPLIHYPVNKWLLGIYPKYHTQLFPDSRLLTEKEHVVEDLSFTNTVEKIYITGISDILRMRVGDLIVIYRTKDKDKLGEYSSVVTSVCTVVEVRKLEEFSTRQSFIDYCGKGSVFSKGELESFYKSGKYPNIIKLLYNFPLRKRITRHELIYDAGLSRERYWGFHQINDSQFDKILEMGGINESFIINKA